VLFEMRNGSECHRMGLESREIDDVRVADYVYLCRKQQML
jgi:hypothetical protein